MCGTSETRSKRIFFTGPAGFLGSFLCERLLNDGHTVIGNDNYFAGTKRNVAHLLNDPRFEIRERDIVKPQSHVRPTRRPRDRKRCGSRKSAKIRRINK